VENPVFLFCFRYGFVTTFGILLNLGFDVSVQQTPWWQFDGGTELGEGRYIVWPDDFAVLAIQQEAVFLHPTQANEDVMPRLSD